MNWKQTTLGEISSNIQTGPFGSQLHQSDYSENGIPVVMPKDILNGHVSDISIARVPEEYANRLNRHKIEPGDILYSRRGDVGRCAFTTDIEAGWLCGTGCLRVTIDQRKAIPKFVFYQLQKTETIGWVEKHAVGSTMLNLNTSILSNVPIQIPSIDKQRFIVGVLSAYDNLIENNQKQIKLLEEAAQRLYKEWFVDLRFPGHENTKITDGIPEGWSVQSINDIAEYINGYAFKPSDWGNLGKPIIKIKEMGSGIASDTPRNTGESIPERYNVTAGDILFSWSATLSAKIWDEEDGLLNQHLFKVIPHGGVSREFVLQSILKTLDEFSNLTTGSTMKHIQRGKLKEVHIIVPNEQMMHIYESISEPSREQILKLKKRIVILQEARDRLLPKLMSGEIEV